MASTSFLVESSSPLYAIFIRRLRELHLRFVEVKLTRLPFFCVCMHLLYLDDAGSAANAKEEYFVLAGVSVFEAQTNWFTQELDRLAQSFDAANPSQVEFHASEIFSRRASPWDSMSREDAQGVIKAVLQVLAKSYDSARVFACAVHKASFRRYNARDTQYFDIFASKFDSVDGVIHGLAHKQTVDQNCMCPACLSRRISQTIRGVTGEG
jgi:hypothetical protein